MNAQILRKPISVYRVAALGWTGRLAGDLTATPFKGCLGTREERIWCFHQYLLARRGLS
jgi:hypothetical protein